MEVTLPDTAPVNQELCRILRSLGEEMQDLDDLEPGDKEDIYDSGYSRVGSWSVTADPD